MEEVREELPGERGRFVREVQRARADRSVRGSTPQDQADADEHQPAGDRAKLGEPGGIV